MLRFVYRYEKPVTISSVKGQYDAGATVSFHGKDRQILYSKKCYESNGHRVNTCALDFKAVTGTTFYLKIDTSHSDWNWMGKWTLDDGCSGDDCWRHIFACV